MGARRQGVVLGTAAIVFGAAAYAGCEAVPDITFDAEDAARSDGPAGDAASGTDAKVPDAGDAGLCNGTAPEPGAVCCPPFWCVGDCVGKCAECAQKCNGSQICCPKVGNVQCKGKCN